MEATGLAIGSIPLVFDYLRVHRRGPGALGPTAHAESWTHDRWKRLKQEYGLFSALALLTVFKDALHVMERVERHVLHGRDHEALVFKGSYSGSFKMVAVAGAIVAQVAITALSLPKLNETHWAVEGFFIASLIFGSLSVFFSCMTYRVVNTLHGADDIRDWLCKPILSKQKRKFQGLLDTLESAIYCPQANTPGGQAYAQLEDAIKNDRWKVASFSSAVMLIAPARLLSLALNAFVAGLGVYLGLVYMASLIPISGSNGSLAVLICYIFATFCGLALFYIPLGFKNLELKPVKRFRRLMHVVHPRQERSGRIWEEGIAVNVPNSGGRAKPPSRHDVVGNLKLQEQTTPSLATQQCRSADDSDLGESGRQGETPVVNASFDHMPASSTDRFQSALEAFVEAQERSLQASKSVLEEYRAMHSAEV